MGALQGPKLERMVGAILDSMEIRIRLDGETDDQFRDRVERMARIATVLVHAALESVSVQQMIADGTLPQTAQAVRENPSLRVEYDQAIAIGDLGSGLGSTRNKHWGAGPRIMPLKPDDPVDLWRVLYLYRENCVYHRRFVQRQRMKRLLSREHRKLVKMAKRETKRRFIESLTEEQTWVIRRKFRVGPAEFWKAVKGRAFLDLPTPLVQMEFEFDGEHNSRR